MATIHIVEDDMIIAADISMQLTKLGYTILGINTRAEDALAAFTLNPPDIVLMDINLGGAMNGIEASAEILRTTKIPVIFLTSNADDATFQEALKTKPYAFISKPFQRSDLERNLMIAVERIAVAKEEEASTPDDNHQNEGEEAIAIMNDRLFLRHKDMMVKVALENILFVEADRNYCRVHTSDETYFLSVSLSKFIVNLTPQYFLRIHRSYVVNLNKIDAINDRHEFVQIQKNQIPVSRRLRPELVQRLKLI